MCGWVFASTSGLTRIETGAWTSRARATPSSAASSSADSTWKLAMPASSACSISLVVLPTPLITIRSGRPAGEEHATELAPAHDVEARAVVREQAQHGEVRERLHREADEVVDRREGFVEDAQVSEERGLAVHVGRRSELRGDRLERAVLRVEDAIHVREVVHQPARPNAWWSTRMASSARSSATTQAILDLARRDELDVDADRRERLERIRRDARMAPHAGADHRHLGHLLVGLDPLAAELVRDARGDLGGARQVAALDGEGQRALALHARRRDDDHVDVDALLRERTEDLRGRPWPRRQMVERELRAVLVDGEAAHADVFHLFLLELRAELVLGDDPRAFALVERRAHVDAHVVIERELDRADLQHLGAERGELEHLLARDARELPCVGADPRVGRVDAVDVRVDLADVGLQRGGERHAGRVGAAAAERRDVSVLVLALEPRHDGDLAASERRAQRIVVDREDPRAARTGCRCAFRSGRRGTSAPCRPPPGSRAPRAPPRPAPPSPRARRSRADRDGNGSGAPSRGAGSSRRPSRSR